MLKQQNPIETATIFIQSGEYLQAEHVLLSFKKGKKNPLYWFLLGASQASQTKNINAINSFKKCLQLQPNYPEAHNNLGVVLEREGKLSAAQDSYSKALKLNPGYISAAYNFANVLQRKRQFAEAIEAYGRVLTLNAGHINSLNNLGLCYLFENNLEKAQSIFQEALKLSPDDVELLINMASALYKMKEYHQAIEYLSTAKSLAPNKPEVYCDLGLNLQALENYGDAEKQLTHAKQLAPNNEKVLGNLGNLFKAQGDHHLAIDYYERTLSCNDKNIDVLNNMAISLLNIKEFEKALVCYKRILKLEPDNTNAQYNLGTYYLSSGKLNDGWRYYFSRPSHKNPNCESPLNLNEESIINKNILLIHEQGIGDELFFLRYLKKLSTKSKNIDYLASPKVAPLLGQQPLIKNVYTQLPDISEYDHIISVGDLPLIVQSETNDFPESLLIDINQQTKTGLQQYLKTLGPPPYIGLTWRAGQNIDNFLFKHVPIKSLFSALENIKGTILVLQRAPSSDELTEVKAYESSHNIHDLSKYNDDLPKMLGLLNELDEYIGVSNTNVHLLAALKKPAHVLVQNLAEWRWMFQGDESPWFPGNQVYRQELHNGWSKAIDNLKRNLEEKYIEKSN